MSKTLVCRCEDVTLHELETAMVRGHRDVESVKRYTGYGTGWCQGKWCQALCARLIAERGGDASDPFTARPPYRPVRFADLAGLDDVGVRGRADVGDTGETPGHQGIMAPSAMATAEAPHSTAPTSILPPPPGHGAGGGPDDG